MTAPDTAQVGAELRRMREDAALTGVQVATAVGWTQSKVSRVETGRFAASLTELAVLLDFYGAAEDVRAELLARSARREGITGAWVVRAGGPRARQDSLAAVEVRASRLRQFQQAVVPGLLQVPAYTRALAELAEFADVGGIASRRSTRRLEFWSEAPLYEVVLSEGALMTGPSSQPVMEEQLGRLLEVPASVSLRVLPLDSANAASALTSFLMFDFAPSRPSVVLVEAQTADLYLSSEGDVAAYSRLFDRLRSASLNEEESRKIIERIRRRSRRVTREEGA